MNRAICLLLLLLKVQASSLRESKKRIPYSPKDISEATAILSATREEEQREVSALAAVASVSDAFERTASVDDEYPVPVLEQETSLSLETVDATAASSEAEEDEYERGFNQLLEALRLVHVAPLAGEKLVTVSTVDSVEELSLREQLRRESRLLDESHDKPFEEIDAEESVGDNEEITPSIDTTIYADTPPSTPPSTSPSNTPSTSSFKIALALYNQFLNAPNQLQLSLQYSTLLHSQPPSTLTPFHLLLSLARIIRTHQGSYPRAQVFLEPWRLEKALSGILELSEKMRGAELCLWLGMEGVARAVLVSHVTHKTGPSSIQLAGVEYGFPASEVDGVTQLAWMSAAMGLEKVYALVTKEAQIEENDKEFFELLLK